MFANESMLTTPFPILTTEAEQVTTLEQVRKGPFFLSGRHFDETAVCTLKWQRNLHLKMRLLFENAHPLHCHRQVLGKLMVSDP